MTAQLIDGNALSQQVRADVAQRAAALTARGVTPGLAVIMVGENPASAVYVRNKVKACADHGLHSVLEQYPATLTQAELLARVQALNADDVALLDFSEIGMMDYSCADEIVAKLVLNHAAADTPYSYFVFHGITDTHLEAIERGLKVMDTTALSLCMDNRVPIHVFELAEGNIVRVASGERIGTIVTTREEA